MKEFSQRWCVVGTLIFSFCVGDLRPVLSDRTMVVVLWCVKAEREGSEVCVCVKKKKGDNNAEDWRGCVSCFLFLSNLSLLSFSTVCWFADWFRLFLPLLRHAFDFYLVELFFTVKKQIISRSPCVSIPLPFRFHPPLPNNTVVLRSLISSFLLLFSPVCVEGVDLALIRERLQFAHKGGHSTFAL